MKTKQDYAKNRALEKLNNVYISGMFVDFEKINRMGLRKLQSYANEKTIELANRNKKRGIA